MDTQRERLLALYLSLSRVQDEWNRINADYTPRHYDTLRDLERRMRVIEFDIETQETELGEWINPETGLWEPQQGRQTWQE